MVDAQNPEKTGKAGPCFCALLSKALFLHRHLSAVEQQVTALIDELKTTERAYFGKDRVKVLKAKIDEAIALLDTKPIDMGKSHPQKAPTL